MTDRLEVLKPDEVDRTKTKDIPKEKVCRAAEKLDMVRIVPL